MNQEYIYEVPVYDGCYKCWRILNLSTGSLYTTEYETEEKAAENIEDGVGRAMCIVKRVSLRQLVETLDA